MENTNKLFICAIAALICAIASAETIWLEAEAFDDWGGWVNDTQFMDQMGSPYLLAHGLGKKVEDAKTSFNVKGGEYGVWIRTKNWTEPWSGEAAGLFSILVNGKTVGAPLGDGSSEWSWRNAGKVQLVPGKHTLALRDLTGFDGRCDAVVLTTDNVSAVSLAASQGPSLAIKPLQSKKYDLVVVGGGVAGICAAVSASRLGLSTALVHDRPVLGGNNSSEVRVHLGAYQNVPPYPRLGDVLAEFAPASGGNARHKRNYEDERKMEVVKAEKNLDLFLNEHVNNVNTNENGRIVAVTAVNTRTGVKTRIDGFLFADCTGDGTVGYLAGADFRMGRESKAETGEPSAPEKADTLTMGTSVQWYAGKADGDDRFHSRPWMLANFNEENCSPELRGDWRWETGFGRDQIDEAEYIRDYGLLVVYSNWAFLKNASSEKENFADKELKWVAYNAGRRESRRLLGDFILSQTHIRNRDFQPDGTCAATWTIDLHLPKPESKTKFKGESFMSDSFNECIWPYPVPYRCFYSRNVPNLFMAGRDISVTHVALGTTRLMRTHGMMGEVVGMAASVCKKHSCDPRGVYERHFDKLKELMTKGVGDGKRYPRQTYNLQRSLDRKLRQKYEESVEGRITETKSKE